MPGRMRLATTLTALAMAGPVLGLSACGNKHEVIKEAETEGVYVNVGELKYQVQISRALNPRAISEDATFIEGVEEELAADEVWFAVFVRVENETDEPVVPAEHFEIEDQLDEVYEPVEIPETNAFHYSLDPVGPKSAAPSPDSVARQLGSIGGMLQLFKLKKATLDNRPLELIISTDEPEDEATVELDV
jgi:hypothetical protein